jgi:hypothetical protein
MQHDPSLHLPPFFSHACNINSVSLSSSCIHRVENVGGSAHAS